jgi:integrase
MGEKNRSGVRTEARDGRRILVVDFRYKDETGRDKRYRRDAAVQTAAGARAEAERLKRLAAARGTLDADPEVPTFASYVEGDFARLVMVRFKASTREGYQQLLDAHGHGLVALLGRKRLDTIGAADARAVEADALTRKAKPRYALVCLRTVLRSAVELGVVASMPRLPKLPAKSEKLPAAPPLAVVVQTLQAADGWLRVAIALAALAGLRCGEVRAIEVRDVDLDAGRLFVRRAFSADELGAPKGRDERAVPLTPMLAAILAEACDGKPATAKLVADGRGEALSEATIGASWRRMQERLGWSPLWHYHQLRHFFATALLRGGANVEAVRRLLGHKSLEPTMRYLHASERDMVAAVAALSGNCGETPQRPCP